MRPRTPARLLLPTLLLALALALAAAPCATGGGRIDLAGEPYARALARFVTASGGVRYAALKADRADLDAFVTALAAGTPADLEALPEADRIAFWLNAYNALTVRTVVDAHPIRARGLAALRFPASSIRQVSGAWTERRWTVLGVRMSLDDIEHETLRARFAEPRVHVALVCAALGCPPLRSEPYVGARLADQLDDQARRYLASPAGLRVAAGGARIEVSSIFKWFAGDFAPAGGVRAFLARHAPAAARDALASGASLAYLDYDWSLNDAPGKP